MMLKVYEPVQLFIIDVSGERLGTVTSTRATSSVAPPHVRHRLLSGSRR